MTQGPGKPLQVLMITSQFLPEVFGGAEQQCLRLSRALLAQGVIPHILTSRSDPATQAEEVLDGITVTRLFCKDPPQMGGARILSTIRWVRAVWTWIADHADQIDIIHCHQAKINAYAGVRAARKHGKPSLVKLGAAGPNLDFFSLEKKRYFYGKYAAHYIARHVNQVVSISQDMAHEIAEYGIPPGRRIMIPNGVALPSVALDSRSRLRTDLGVVADQPVVLFVGRMSRQKNVPMLLEAFATCRTEARLVLLGDGEDMAEFQALADRLGLTGRADFRGLVYNVPEYLTAADLFVLPALAEGLSNALLEAMCLGVPPIVSKVSGNVDLVIERETGWLFNLSDGAEGLAACLQTALDAGPTSWSGVSAAAQDLVAQNYALDSVAERYRALYDQLLAEQAA